MLRLKQNAPTALEHEENFPRHLLFKIAADVERLELFSASGISGLYASLAASGRARSSGHDRTSTMAPRPVPVAARVRLGGSNGPQTSTAGGGVRATGSAAVAAATAASAAAAPAATGDANNVRTDVPGHRAAVRPRQKPRAAAAPRHRGAAWAAEETALERPERDSRGVRPVSAARAAAAAAASAVVTSKTGKCTQRAAGAHIGAVCDLMSVRCVVTRSGSGASKLDAG